MVAQEARCAEKKNEQQDEPAGHKLCNCSFHRSNDLTAEGRRGRADGRARSPVLSASAVAVLKMADCVSWPTLRADAKFRCALTISGEVLSPFLYDSSTASNAFCDAVTSRAAESCLRRAVLKSV